MRLYSIYVIVFLSVLANCHGYKLRRDITKVRHYCKEICIQCGGEAALSQDVCICNIEAAEGEESQNCLEQAKNKFDFFGIKLETDNRPVNKRSIYRGFHQLHPGLQRSHAYVKPKQEKISQDVYSLENGDNIRSKRSHSDYGSLLDTTGFGEIFRPKEAKTLYSPISFKILFGSSKPKRPDTDRGPYYPYYDMMVSSERNNEEDHSEDENNSNGAIDYADDRATLGDELDLRRLISDSFNWLNIYLSP